MKQTLFLLFLIFCLTANAQQKRRATFTIDDPRTDSLFAKNQGATLTITVLHAPDTIIKVPVKCTFVGFGSAFHVSKFYQFTKNGILKISFDHHLPYQQIWLSVDHYLYAGVYVNKELSISIDANKIKNPDGFYMIDDGVKYSGIDGEFNTVMNKHVLYKQDLVNKLKNNLYEISMKRTKYGENALLSKCDSIYEAVRTIDKEFTDRYLNYRWVIQNNFDAYYYGILCTAFWGDKMPDTILRKIDSFSPYLTSNESVLFYNYYFHYLIFKKDNPRINVDEQLLANYPNYNPEQKAVLDSLNYYSKFTDDYNRGAKNQINKKRQELFFEEIERIYIKEHLRLIDSIYTPPKSDILKTFLLSKAKNTFAQAYPEIMTNMQTKWCREIVEAELDQASLKQKQIDSLLAKGVQVHQSNLYIGKPLDSLPFNANLYELDSIKSLDEFVVDLISKFPNKALVIDFWATWCAPCLKEMPFSKQLHENNKDLPIAFIYICTKSSSNITVWKNKIAALQLPGTHIFADDKLVTELKNKLNSEGSGFPAYVVIDINGKLKPKAIEWMRVLDRDALKSAVGL